MSWPKTSCLWSALHIYLPVQSTCSRSSRWNISWHIELVVEHCKSTYVTHLNTHTIHPRKLPSSSTGELALFDPSVSIHVFTKAGAPLENKLVTSQSHIGLRNFELLAQVAFKVPRLFDRRNCTPHVVQRSNTHRQRTKLPLNIGGWRRLAKAIVSLFTLVF
jgi:hypothetical protein